MSTAGMSADQKIAYMQRRIDAARGTSSSSGGGFGRGAGGAPQAPIRLDWDNPRASLLLLFSGLSRAEGRCIFSGSSLLRPLAPS